MLGLMWQFPRLSYYATSLLLKVGVLAQRTLRRLARRWLVNTSTSVLPQVTKGDVESHHVPKGSLEFDEIHVSIYDV